MPLMFSVSGLRGIVGRDMHPATVAHYAAHFGRFTGAGTIIVGRDTRKSGKEFREAVIRGLSRVGCRVKDLGIVPTPTVVYMVRRLRARGGIAITASHNPSQWNALKFVSAGGRFLNRNEFRSFRRMTETEIIGESDDGVIQEPDIMDAGFTQHIDTIVRTLNIRSAGLRVGVDAVNGAGSVALPHLLRRMGCRVYTVHCGLRADFPRPPEPVAAHLAVLRRLVRDSNLDLGLACDPDADRLSCVDEKAHAIGEEKTLVLAADHVLQRMRRPLVTNLSTTALIDDVARKYGVRVFRTPVGEAHVVGRMMQTHAGIGGEGNGGVIYPRINFTRDALVAAALVVKMMMRQGKTLSEICSAYPTYFMIKTKLAIPREYFERRTKKLLSKICGRVNRRDGLKITARDHWVHIRPSQTEPLVRVIAEARERKTAHDVVAEVRNILT